MLAVILSCKQRLKVLASLLVDLADSDWDYPVISVMDDEAVEFAGKESSQRTAYRCAENFHLAIKRGYSSGVPWFVLFEDDSEVNINLKFNLHSWEPMQDGSLGYGGLSTNGGNRDSLGEGRDWYIPDSNLVYGVQGAVLTREFAKFVLDEWDMFPPLMPDMKLARMAGMNRVGRYCKHWPSLVRHRHEIGSTFDDHGVVKTEGFDRFWKA